VVVGAAGLAVAPSRPGVQVGVRLPGATLAAQDV
jgi:hypothetical protein